MEIVAFDEDDRADGNGKVGITWISKTLLNSTHAMNASATTEGGWEACAMRSYLKNTIKPLIPGTVRNAIKEVTKVQSTYTGGASVVNGQTTTEDVWIPSRHEIFGSTAYESTGPVYTTKFNDAASRIKKKHGSTYEWWLRSAHDTHYFSNMQYSGYGDNNNANSRYGVALGFCTN